MGSTSPSITIHFGYSLVMLERSRIRLENRPVIHMVGLIHNKVFDYNGDTPIKLAVICNYKAWMAYSLL